MTQTMVALVVGLLTAAVTITGWYVSYATTKRREERMRRVEARLRHVQRQIEELYSPLLALIQYAATVYQIARQKNADPETMARGEIWRFFVERYFLPLNAQMATLIRQKIHLLHTPELPESFRAFLRHQSQYDCLHTLWKETGQTSDEFHGGWPKDFEGDVQAALSDLRREYNEYVARLNTTA
jgi:hypothetical protein